MKTAMVSLEMPSEPAPVAASGRQNGGENWVKEGRKRAKDRANSEREGSIDLAWSVGPAKQSLNSAIVSKRERERD